MAISWGHSSWRVSWHIICGTWAAGPAGRCTADCTLTNFFPALRNSPQVWVYMQHSFWISTFLFAGLPMGICKIDYHDHHTSALSACVKVHWRCLWMQRGNMWGHNLLLCLWDHIRQRLRHSWSCYTFCCEMGTSVYQTWKQTFGIFFMAVKVQGM